MLKVIFLGTGGSMPTPERGMPAIMVQRDGERLLFDCGEGTQRQMMRARSGFMDISSIFLSHFHADHTLGIPGLLQTMSFQGRTEPLYIYGPAYTRDFCEILTSVAYLRPGFEIVPVELKHGESVKEDGYRVDAFRTFHRVPSLGYAFFEDARPGRFNKARALELGVPEGPLFSRLHRGETVVVNGREVRSSDVVGEPRPGRSIVYSGDTIPSQTFLPFLHNVDLWISESTFSFDLENKACETMHSTAAEVGALASLARVKMLALTHFSSRYSEDSGPILDEAKRSFGGNVVIAEDFMEIEIPLKD